MRQADGAAQAVSKPKFNFSKASVVAIDANALCLDVLTGILSGFGFRRVTRFSDLQQGVDYIKKHAIDLIVIDPLRFGEEAFAFVEWMRTQEHGPNVDTPVIFVTGHTSVRMVTTTRQCGADYVVAKPFSTSVLLERILWVATHDPRKDDGPSILDLVAAPRTEAN